MAYIQLTNADREHLKNIGASTLPDNPAQARYSPREIKSAISRPQLLLFDWLRGLGDYVSSSEIIHVVDKTDDAIRYGVGAVTLLNDGEDLRFYRNDYNGIPNPIGDGLIATADRFGNHYTKAETDNLIALAIAEMRERLGLVEITAADVNEWWGEEDYTNYDFEF